MADGDDREDRTEAATPYRLQQARQEGRAPMSRELGSVAVLAASAVLLARVMPLLVQEAARLLAALLARSERLDVVTALAIAGRSVLLLALPFALAALAVGSLSALLQTGGVMRFSAFLPDLARIHPLRGLTRLFGRHNLMEAGKSLAKLVFVGGAGVLALWGVLPVLSAQLDATPAGLAIQISRQVLGVMTAMLVAQGVITGLDVLRSRLSFNASLRMTRQELRDESKQNDGNPQVKGRLRRIRMQRARRRMMAAVPKATVVVTNPTHYAVALAYERGQGGSPRIVAKGVDEVAARIREIALEHRVPLVANPPLARALHARPLDSEIPAEHFKMVAEIIAYVWRLKGVGLKGVGLKGVGR